MDRYQRVEKPKPESPIQENEIRITTQGLVRNYVSYGISLLQDKHAEEVTLKAMGQAINKAVVVVEFLKKQFPALHQDTSISSVCLTDVWEPIEEGLLPVETTHQVSMISITLSTKRLNTTSPGYQAPNLAESSNPQQHPRQARDQYNGGFRDSYGRGGGRERGRGRGRGWGRGHGDYYQDNHGYNNNWGQGQMGRGRSFYRGDNYSQTAYDQGYDQRHGGGYAQGRDGGYERGHRGSGGFQRGRVVAYERGRGTGYGGGRGSGYGGGRGSGYERGRAGGYDRGQGRFPRVRGEYDHEQAGGYEEGGRGGGDEYGRSRGEYARGRRVGYEEGQGGGGAYGRSRGGYARGRDGYEEGPGAAYEQGRGSYGRGRSGGRSRGGGY